MPTLIIYGLMALAALGVLGGLYYKVHHAGYEEGIAEVTPKLTACEGREKALGTQIDAQNKAVAALEETGKAKVAAATKGLEQAKKRAVGAESEAARLRGLAGKGGSTSCPAGEAAEQIRKGLAR